MHIESFVRLLIADPSNHIRQEILHALQSARYETEFTLVETEDEFQSSLESNRYDLILSGLRLQDCSWDSLLALSKEAAPEALFILITERYKKELVEKATRLGVDDMIADSQLIQLTQVLERHRRVPEQGTATAESERLAKMSHELRTPLSSMIVLSKLLSENRDGNLNAKQIEYLNVIRYTGNSLLEILNDSLDQAKRAAEEKLLRKSSVHLFSLCDNVYKLFRPVAEKKGIRFRLEMDRTLPENIYTDRLRMEQILRNLISNALKFTDQNGTVDFRISQSDPGAWNRETGDSGKMILFSISDTGIGIPEEKQKLIFNSYEQGGSMTRETYGGTGLGLAISSELARLLGGEITLESEPEEGSCFTLCIPAVTADSVPDGKSDHPLVKSPLRKDRTRARENRHEPYLTVSEEPLPYHPPGDPARHVKSHSGNSLHNLLLIDDNKMHTAALKEYLQDVAQKIYRASSPKETLKLLEKENVACIVLDLMLKNRSGFDLMKEIKEYSEYQHIPVIIYTGQSLSQPDENRIMNLATAIVYKNVNSYQLLKKEILAVMEEL